VCQQRDGGAADRGRKSSGRRRRSSLSRKSSGRKRRNRKKRECWGEGKVEDEHVAMRFD